MERELSGGSKPPAQGEIEIKWLGGLMAAGLTVGTAATAIETAGIHGADRYGRFGHFKAGSTDARGVLDMLAARFARQSDPAHGYDPAVDDAELERFDRFGWPAASCPDFSAIASAQKVVTPPAPRDDQASALAALGAVRALVVRAEGSGGRAPFSSNAQLIQKIHDTYGEPRGFGKRSLEELFPKADRALEERLKALQERLKALSVASR